MDPKNTLPIKVAILADPEIVIFGAVKLPPALIKPAVKMFPPVIFAAEVIVLVADTKPAVNKLPPVMLPLPAIVPNTLTPVGENTVTLPTPLTETVILAAAVAMLILLLPFVTLETDVIIPVNSEPFPSIKLPVTLPVADTTPVVKILPACTFPEADIPPPPPLVMNELA